MLEKGAHVDLQANNGRSALMDACREGHLEVAKLLLESKANINLQSLNWESAMSLALEHCLKMESALESALRKQLDLIASLAGEDTSRAAEDKGSNVANTSKSTTYDHIPLSVSTLTLLKWKDQNGETQKFELIKLVSARWKDFGIRLQQTINDLDGLEMQYMRDFKLCWCKVMQVWLDDLGTSNYPASWKGVMTLLEDVSYTQVARELENTLAMISPPTQPPPVFEMCGKFLDPHLSQQFVMWLKRNVAFEAKLYEIFQLKLVKL